MSLDMSNTIALHRAIQVDMQIPDTIAPTGLVVSSDFLQAAATTYAEYLSTQMGGVQLPDTAISGLTASVVSASFLQTRALESRRDRRGAASSKLSERREQRKEEDTTRLEKQIPTLNVGTLTGGGSSSAVTVQIDASVNVPAALYSSAALAWPMQGAVGGSLSGMFQANLQAQSLTFASVTVSNVEDVTVATTTTTTTTTIATTTTTTTTTIATTAAPPVAPPYTGRPEWVDDLFDFIDAKFTTPCPPPPPVTPDPTQAAMGSVLGAMMGGGAAPGYGGGYGVPPAAGGGGAYGYGYPGYAGGYGGGYAPQAASAPAPATPSPGVFSLMGLQELSGTIGAALNASSQVSAAQTPPNINVTIGSDVLQGAPGGSPPSHNLYISGGGATPGVSYTGTRGGGGASVQTPGPAPAAAAAAATPAPAPAGAAAPATPFLLENGRDDLDQRDADGAMPMAAADVETGPPPWAEKLMGDIHFLKQNPPPPPE